MMDEDELDPRIQVELEKLNSATDIINKLEIELDEANTTFRMLLNECTRRLKVHSSKHGSAIENARPYYQALDVARLAQQECQQAAVSFQRANEVHEAAKETVALAESRFMSQQPRVSCVSHLCLTEVHEAAKETVALAESRFMSQQPQVHEAAKETVALAESRFMSQQPEWRFDSAWQEMLNHATIKVRDAEKQRAESSAHHGRATAHYKQAQDKVQLLEQRLRRNVAKSRPYFEEKQRCNQQLAAQKEAVETLAAKVARVKADYAASLRRLEGISEEIHRRRGNMQTGGCGVREPGVGAELEYVGEVVSSSDRPSYDKEIGYADVPLDVGSRKISFDSLHALHFNPSAGRDDRSVGESCDSDSDVVTDVSLDLVTEFVCPPCEAGSSKRGLTSGGPADDDRDVRDEGGDIERACDRLEAIALTSGAKVVENAEACARGDAERAKNEERRDVDVVESLSGCDDDTPLGRQPDLELTFQRGGTTQEDDGGVATLKSRAVNPSGTRGESPDVETSAERPLRVPNQVLATSPAGDE